MLALSRFTNRTDDLHSTAPNERSQALTIPAPEQCRNTHPWSPALLVPFNVVSDQVERGTDQSCQGAHTWTQSQQNLVSILPLAKTSLEWLGSKAGSRGVQLSSGIWNILLSVCPFPEHCFLRKEVGRASAPRVRMGDTLPR